MDIKSKKRKRSYRFLKEFLVKTALIIAIATVFFTFVFKVHRATGNTMSPFVRDGDLCVFYILEKAALNDVVLYETDQGLKIGRIVATGGQTVEFQEDGGYTVDSYIPTEEIPYETYQAEGSDIENPITLSEDEFFIMNDFRSLTTDSREAGPVNEKQIRGKLLFMLRRRNF